MTEALSASLRPEEALEALRFAVPWRTRVAVLTPTAAPTAAPTAGAELPDLGRSRAVQILDPDPAATLGDRITALREEGCEYLLVPAPWLEEESIRAHLAPATLVENVEGGHAIFSLHPPPAAPANDGLPLPPAHLIRVTSGCLHQAVNNPARMYESYVERGLEGAACIRSALGRFGMDIAGFDSVLDFGCGCGRVLRQLAPLSGARMHGCDYNPLLIEWCRANLPLAEFRVNPIDPPLSYEDGRFDFLYAISILTHLDEAQQGPWLRELARVVRPGGVLLLTVAGESRAERQLSGADLERFRSGELVVTRGNLAGTNACATFHPERYLRGMLTGELELIGLVTDGARDVRQDQVLMRKAS